MEEVSAFHDVTVFLYFFVSELLSSDAMKEYNRARVYLDENYKSQEHFTVSTGEVPRLITLSRSFDRKLTIHQTEVHKVRIALRKASKVLYQTCVNTPSEDDRSCTSEASLLCPASTHTCTCSVSDCTFRLHFVGVRLVLKHFSSFVSKIQRFYVDAEEESMSLEQKLLDKI